METTTRTTQLIKTTLKDVFLLNLPKIQDPRGNLSVIENNIIPFEIKRVYYLYDVPSGAYRGGHAHEELYQFLIPLSGSFDVILKDGKASKTVSLNKPNVGLLIVPGIWRELNNFSSGAVCLVLASTEFDESDYVRNFEEYLLLKNT